MKTKQATTTNTKTWIDECLRVINHIESRYNDGKQGFQAKMEEHGISEAIAWYGEFAVRTEAEWNRVRGLSNFLKGHDVTLEAVAKWLAEARRDTISTFRLASSTSQFSNVTENTDREARVRMLDPMGGTLTMLEYIVSEAMKEAEGK